MDLKAQEKLLKVVSIFCGYRLNSAKFNEKKTSKGEVLILELNFINNLDEKKTMVLVLDKDLTLGDYKELYSKIID